MGYYTTFYGDISYKNPKVVNLLNKFAHEKTMISEFDDIDINSKNKIVCFSGLQIKDYNGFVERICMAIAFFDREAYGEIECNGEEKEDIWKIVIGKGKVDIWVGQVKYVKGKQALRGEYSEMWNETKRYVAKLTKRTDLIKEATLGEI